jgi:transcriptional regulator with GAF, ATPase, and Fis domain
VDSERGRDDELRTVQQDPSPLAGPQRHVITVVVGNDRGLEYVFDDAAPPRVLIGQSPVCAIRLEDVRVSRRHAALSYVDDELRVLDLDSTNGTRVNGVRVIEAVVGTGDTIRLGETALRVDAAPRLSQAKLSSATGFGRVVGSSVEMRRLYPLFERIAASDVNVVVEGETGTGKEVLVESLHEGSRRAAGPFVVFDCTAVAAGLVESELFGHERGAFTGATATRKGVFEQADGGTVFIDEIGELDVSLQPKLLRVLERSEVRRVGGTEWIRVDVRVIVATRRDLDREVQDGRFRDDLFFRLNVARVELPPLRQRRGDIGVLAEHFWRELGGGPRPIPYDVLQRFERHDWPGNVRELRNGVARQLALGELLDARSSAKEEREPRNPFEHVLSQKLPFPRARDRILHDFERQYIARVLEEHGGSVARAAQASGIARRYFNTILARHAPPRGGPARRRSPRSPQGQGG